MFVFLHICVICFPHDIFKPKCLVLYVCVVDRYLSFCASFGHCVVCSSSIYGFWLPLWYLQTLLKSFGFPIFQYWASPDESYSRNVSCAPYSIATFVLPSHGWYNCWWTISPRGHHPSCSQCFDTDMVNKKRSKTISLQTLFGRLN